MDELLYIQVEHGMSAGVFKLTGRRVISVSLTGRITAIPVSDLPAGEYIVKVVTSSGTGIYTLIKK